MQYVIITALIIMINYSYGSAQSSLNDIEHLREESKQLIAYCKTGQLNKINSFYRTFQDLNYVGKKTVLAEVDIQELKISYDDAVRTKILNYLKHGWQATAYFAIGAVAASLMTCAMDTNQCQNYFVGGFDAAGIVVILNMGKNLGLTLYEACNARKHMIDDFEKFKKPILEV
jgi:hypothetical protein